MSHLQDLEYGNRRLDALDSAGVTTEVSSEDTLNQSISSIAEEEEGEVR